MKSSAVCLCYNKAHAVPISHGTCAILTNIFLVSSVADWDNHTSLAKWLRPVWLNGWVFVYKLSGCGFESRCYQLNFSYGSCFKQGVPWHSGNRTLRNDYLKLKHAFRKTTAGQNSLSFLGPSKWNKFPESTKKCNNINTFKHNLKKFYLAQLAN